MKQPELGKLIASERSNKNLSQESLAEACDISSRTVQRIEKGTVIPQSYTLKSICEVIEIKLNENGTAENNIWLALIHFSSMFLMVPVPLILWAWKGHHDAILTSHAKQAMNFQVSWSLLLFAWFGITSVAMFLIGFQNDLITPQSVALLTSLSWMVIPGITALFITYCSIVNITRSTSMKETHYPLTIPFWK